MRRMPLIGAAMAFAIFTGGAAHGNSLIHPIVALGDSITHGEPDPGTGWVASLRAAGVPIEDAGIPGNRTDQMLGRLSDVLERQPSLVLVMGGTNDLNQGVPESRIIANLRSIVETLRTSRVGVILMTIAPRGTPGWNARIEAVNEAIFGLGRSEGVRVIDVHASLAGDDGLFLPGYSADGVHPTRTGYRVMTAVIRAGLDAR